MGWYPAVVTEAAAAEPVTLADAKTWGRFDDTSDDDRISGALTAARAYVEAFTGQLISEQTAAIKCDSFCDFEYLPLAPVQSISSITYVDGAGDTQTLDAAVYELRAEGLRSAIVRKYGQSWPGIQCGSRITVTAVCGYAADALPPAPLQAIRMYAIAQVDGVLDDATKGMIDALLANERRFL